MRLSGKIKKIQEQEISNMFNIQQYPEVWGLKPEKNSFSLEMIILSSIVRSVGGFFFHGQ